MSDQLVKQVNKTGVSITKEKLLELIRKSPEKQFAYSQCLASKTIVVAIE